MSLQLFSLYLLCGHTIRLGFPHFKGSKKGLLTVLVSVNRIEKKLHKHILDKKISTSINIVYIFYFLTWKIMTVFSNWLYLFHLSLSTHVIICKTKPRSYLIIAYVENAFILPFSYNMSSIIPRWSMLRKSVALDEAQFKNFFQVDWRFDITFVISSCLF